MSLNHHLPKKISLVPKKHHGFQFVLFLLGVLLPPIAVAVRFGIGSDFFVNTILCILGYFPCHFHNFYIQNIRNNTHRARTPKWALKAGLIDTTDRDRRTRKNQWAKRYDERNTQSSHVGAALADGETGENYVPVSEAEQERERRRQNEGLWDDENDAEYYNEDQAPNQTHWHYPANFEGAVGGGRKYKRNAAKANNGDRWERSRASRTDSFSSASSYPPVASADNDVPEWGKDYGSKRRSSKNKRKADKGGTAINGRNGWASNGGFVDDAARDDGWGGSGGAGIAQGAGANGAPTKKQSGRSDDVFNHEF